MGWAGKHQRAGRTAGLTLAVALAFVGATAPAAHAQDRLTQASQATGVPGEDEASRLAAWTQAQALSREGRHAEAADLLRSLLALESRDRPTARDTFRVQARLMGDLLDAGDMEGALIEARSGYVGAFANLGADDDLTQDFRIGLGRLLAVTGRYAEAEPILSEDMETELAAGRMEDARSTGFLLARVYDGLNRATDAQAVRLRIAEGDAADPEVLEVRIDALLERGDKVAAEPMARRLVAIQAAGGMPRDLKQAKLRLARSLFHSTEDTADDPRIVEAEALYRALYAQERQGGAQPSSGVAIELGELLLLTAEADTPRQDEGLMLSEAGLAILAATLGEDHPVTLGQLGQVAVYQFGMMHFGDAAASVARIRRAREAGATVSFAATANALTVEAGLALQDDDLVSAHRILTRESARIHADLVSAGRRDDARRLQEQVAYIDRLSVSVAWRAARTEAAGTQASPEG